MTTEMGRQLQNQLESNMLSSTTILWCIQPWEDRSDNTAYFHY